MNARDTLLNRLDSAAMASAPERDAGLQRLKEKIRGLRYIALDDTTALFAARLRENGAEVIECSDGSDIPEALDGILEADISIVLADNGHHTCADLGDRLLALCGNRRIHSSSDARFATTTSDWKTSFAEMDVGITVAAGGIAESGAIITQSSAREQRSLSLLPLHHIAVLTSDTIHATLSDAADTLASLIRDGEGSAVTLIGGPSKTADIEKVLVTGMHGPKRFTVLIVRQTMAEPENQSTPQSHNTEGTAT